MDFAPELKKSATSDVRAALGDLTRKAAPHTTPTHEQVAQRAYERWEGGGCNPSMAEVDWIRAEQRAHKHGSVSEMNLEALTRARRKRGAS